ncbi:MAG: hypothetical protein AAF368_20925 [Planctomycetota bacterium]
MEGGGGKERRKREKKKKKKRGDIYCCRCRSGGRSVYTVAVPVAVRARKGREGDDVAEDQRRSPESRW